MQKKIARASGVRLVTLEKTFSSTASTTTRSESIFESGTVTCEYSKGVRFAGRDKKKDSPFLPFNTREEVLSRRSRNHAEKSGKLPRVLRRDKGELAGVYRRLLLL